LRHDWHKALNVAEEAIGFLAGKRFQITSYLIGFNHQKVSCLLMLEKYEEARTVLDKTLELAAPDSTHHFKNRELATVIFLYAGNYVEAWQTCKNAIRHERFDKIPLIDQEAWRVYYGYLYFLALWGILELSPKEKSELPKFRLSSWLNDLPLFSADKRGAQIPILILQTLLLLFERRWDELDNRIEALRKFRQRNLDPNDEHFRTTCFIHLLELLPKFAFDLPTLSKNAAPWLKKLSSGNIEILDRTYEIEVVPYERQWDWVVTIIGAFK
jgi:tetratricopeptide (TPR) repeat protein